MHILSPAFKGPIEAYPLPDGIFENHLFSKSALIWTISASGSNFDHRNIQNIPVVKIIAFLGPNKTGPFVKVSKG